MVGGGGGFCGCCLSCTSLGKVKGAVSVEGNKKEKITECSCYRKRFYQILFRLICMFVTQTPKRIIHIGFIFILRNH